MVMCNNYYDVVDKLKNTKLSNACKLEPTTEGQAMMFVTCVHVHSDTLLQEQLVTRHHSLSVVRAYIKYTFNLC